MTIHASTATPPSSALLGPDSAQDPRDLLIKMAQQVPGVLFQLALYEDGRCVIPFTSDTVHDVFGLTPAALQALAPAAVNYVHPDDLPRVRRSLLQSSASLTPWGIDFRMQLPGSGERWVHVDARPERCRGRTCWFGFISDTTEGQRAQQTLTQLQVAIDSSLNGVAIGDRTGALTYVNRAMLDLWGYQTRDEVLGRSALSFWRSPEEAQLVGDALFTIGAWTGALTAVRQDGQERTMQVNASAIRDETGTMTGVLASFADITDTRRLETELNQSQKLESIGRLAGGVAHDFNNLLTVITASLELASDVLPPDHAAVADLQEAAYAASSAARLTQQLLAFSRKQVIRPTHLDLNDVVHRVAAMLQRLLGEDIALQITTAHGLHPVRFDPGQAEQVLMNLAVNARDAMPHGGVLTIETSNVPGDLITATSRVRSAESLGVLLTVSDTGTGMTPEVLANAFEPFFTTKGPGEGTGLGLAVIHGAVTQNGGRIDVSSAPGRGTTFRIFLPRAHAAPTRVTVPQAEAVPRGSETILLVEDDVSVRGLMNKVLTQQGYHVIACDSGPMALTWLARASERVDLLLTDVIMPQMNGKALADAVLRTRPEAQVLFASGYTDNVIARHGVLEPDVAFLAKPFTAHALAVKVRHVLDGVAV